MICSIVKTSDRSRTALLPSVRVRAMPRAGGVGVNCASSPGFPRKAVNAPQRKSPSPFGPGLCGVGGEGEGDADHRGGVRAERRPRPGVPKKKGGGADKRSAPEMRTEALRRQLPSQATISRPRLILYLKSAVRKSGRAPPRETARRRISGNSLTISWVWTAAATRANLADGAEDGGVSRRLYPALDWGGFNRDCLGS
jgi:hypothetical protein